ncbi:MAG: hypothetical protein PHF61_04785 [Bacteroidales bacterium]|nr:hypothetical protein [Bacteroidales bacterium]
MSKSLFNIRIIFKFLGYLLMLEAVLMLLCSGVDYLFKDNAQLVFLKAAGLLLVQGCF